MTFADRLPLIYFCFRTWTQTPAADDRSDEVRFTVELTRLAGLNDTYSLDIRRLKGNLRNYKYVYDTIRECVLLTVICVVLIAYPYFKGVQN